jgi:tryptophanyl-tRNA synthetase
MQDLSTLEGKTILTGDRPTGPLHLGHLAGTLQARVALQDKNDVTILVADLQALTDNAGRAADVAANVREVVLDYIAAGIDPDRVTIVRQSDLPALNELTMLYMNLVTVPRLMRIPTIREEIAQRGFGDGTPAGFLCYPVSQAADITAFGADIVPAGADQAPLVEITGEIVGKVNRMAGRDVLTFPTLMQSNAPRLPGIDGAGKMSKSAGNAIALRDSPEKIHAAVMRMFTDPDHLKVSDPGKVEGNVVFAMLDAFDPDPTAVDGLKAHYQAGGLGDMGLKRRLDEIIQELLAPMRARRSAAASDAELVDHILELGRKRAHVITMEALSDVRRAFGLEGRPGRSAALSRMQQTSQECHAEGRIQEGLVDAVSSSRARFSG